MQVFSRTIMFFSLIALLVGACDLASDSDVDAGSDTDSDTDCDGGDCGDRGTISGTCEYGSRLFEWGTYGDGDGEFNEPHGIAIDSRGNVYIADSGNHRVQKFTGEGDFITKWGSQGYADGQFENPLGIEVDSADKIYVADQENHRIQVFTNEGDFITKWGSVGEANGQFQGPSDLAVDSADNIYVVDEYNCRVQVFSSNGDFIREWGSCGDGEGQFNDPEGIAIDSSGSVYVAEFGGNRVQKFTSSGDLILEWSSGGGREFDEPNGITISSSGRVFIVEESDHIMEFTTEGIFVSELAGDFSDLRRIEIDSFDRLYVSEIGPMRIQVLCAMAGGASTELSWCEQQYEPALICEVDETSCMFYVVLDGANCQTYCEEHGGGCITAYADTDDNCGIEESRPCAESANDMICTCTISGNGGTGCPDISPGVATWSCRATRSGEQICVDYPKATWSEGDALASCEANTDYIESWGEANCAVDNFDTTRRCVATRDGIETVPTFVVYSEFMPQSYCVDFLDGVVVERPVDGCWTDYEGFPDPVCPDISPGVATWSCRATQYAQPICVDYPKATWSEANALANCEAAATTGGGTVDSWGYVNCGVDNFDTSWRCVATADLEGSTVPTYIAYAETMPLGFCTTQLAGVVEERPANGCWTDYYDDGGTDGGVGDGGLVAYYPFNGNANDESGNGNDGTVYGAILTEDRFENSESAYAFDGDDDYISRDFNLASGMFPTDAPFTIVAWFNTFADSPAEQVIVSSHNNGCCDGYHVCIDAFNESRLRCFFKIYGEDIPVYSKSTVNDGQWHNVVCMWSDDLIRLYIDGELHDSTEAVGPVEYSSEAPFKIGHSEVAGFDDDYDDYHFSGVLDDVRLYSRSLSATEIENIYQEGGWAE